MTTPFLTAQGKRIHFIHQAAELMQCIDSLTVDAEKFAPQA
jgi:hypothetical protein